jgi:hypothetical protein
MRLYVCLIFDRYYMSTDRVELTRFAEYWEPDAGVHSFSTSTTKITLHYYGRLSDFLLS